MKENSTGLVVLSMDDNRPENLELWTRSQPASIRVEDAVVWAQEVLELYAPELLNGCISEAFEAEQDAGSIPAVSSKWSN